jgi:ACS family hexuronate transporter-like MFS transporter
MIWWWRLSQRADLSVRGDLGGGGKLNWRDRRLWGAMASYSLGSVPLGFILYNSPLYLTARFGLTQAELGQLLWIPPLGWECGYFLWGWLIDRLGLDAAGKLMLVAAALSLPIAAAPATDRLAVLMLQLFLAMLVTSGFIIPSIQHAARITPPGSISLVAGLGAGSFSLLIAILAPWFGRLFDQRDYATAFTAAALFPVLGSSLFAAANGIRGGHRSAGGAGSSPESERR